MFNRLSHPGALMLKLLNVETFNSGTWIVVISLIDMCHIFLLIVQPSLIQQFLLTVVSFSKVYLVNRVGLTYLTPEEIPVMGKMTSSNLFFVIFTYGGSSSHHHTGLFISKVNFKEEKTPIRTLLFSPSTKSYFHPWEGSSEFHSSIQHLLKACHVPGY